MTIVTKLFSSTLGKKFIMAATGFALLIFVIGHLIGNLQIFLDPVHINKYGHFLQTTPELLWGARIGLLICVALHIWAAVSLSIENKAARPVAYVGNPTPRATTYASRTMLMSGLIVLCFIVYHLLHYTVLVQSVNFTCIDFSALREKDTGHHDIHRMMVVGFGNIWVSLFYLLGMGFLCTHLGHGIGAMFSSIGWKSPAYEKAIDGLAKWAAILIFAGYASIPLAILLRIVK